jgi:hypothetical protein
VSIVETNKIDFVAARPNSSVVRLVIADHLDWSDFEEHARLIQAKVNTYLEFVESGQLARTPKIQLPPAPEIHIELVAQHAPSEVADVFLARVKDFLMGVGIAFDVSTRAN